MVVEKVHTDDDPEEARNFRHADKRTVEPDAARYRGIAAVIISAARYPPSTPQIVHVAAAMVVRSEPRWARRTRRPLHAPDPPSFGRFTGVPAASLVIRCGECLLNGADYFRSLGSAVANVEISRRTRPALATKLQRHTAFQGEAHKRSRPARKRSRRVWKGQPPRWWPRLFAGTARYWSGLRAGSRTAIPTWPTNSCRRRSSACGKSVRPGTGPTTRPVCASSWCGTCGTCW